MDKLPNEIVYAIMDKLPVRCLGSIFTTCKNWYVLSREMLIRKLMLEKTYEAENKLFLYTLYESSRIHLDQEQKKIQYNYLMFELKDKYKDPFISRDLYELLPNDILL